MHRIVLFHGILLVPVHNSSRRCLFDTRDTYSNLEVRQVFDKFHMPYMYLHVCTTYTKDNHSADPAT